MIGGQCADICAEELRAADQVTKELLWYVHKNKTAVSLIEAALMIGAVLAGAPDEVVKKLEPAERENIGIAFQIQDDISRRDQFSGSARQTGWKR